MVRVTIGEIGFRVVKPCARCVITTTGQRTGERGGEPLRMLATYRRAGNHVFSGRKLVHEARGTIRPGDVCIVEVG